MSTVRELHDKAMRLSHLALVARETGHSDHATELAREAYHYESQAADLVPDDARAEPTRSILYRSAASLAYQIKEYQTALQLIAKGLSGNPPARVEQELRTLYEQVNFEFFLQSRGVTVEKEEFEMALKGKAVGFGSILYNEFIKRVESIFSLVDRTVQRKMGRDYQRSGRVSQLYRPYTRIIEALQPGSFIVKLRLGNSGIQQLSFLYDTTEIINEIITGIELLNESGEDRLRELIPSEGYYQNFIALARELAPDGDAISSVVFSSSSNSVSMTRRRNEIKLISDENQRKLESNQKPIKVEGILDHATSRQGDSVGLTTADGQQYDVMVKEGFDDMVRSYFKKLVIVTGIYNGKIIEPTDIQFGDNL